MSTTVAMTRQTGILQAFKTNGARVLLTVIRQGAVPVVGILVFLLCGHRSLVA